MFSVSLDSMRSLPTQNALYLPGICVLVVKKNNNKEISLVNKYVFLFREEFFEWSLYVYTNERQVAPCGEGQWDSTQAAMS